MLKKKGQSGQGVSMPVGLGLGTAVSLIVTLLGAAIIAWMVSVEKIGEGSMDLLTRIIHIIASALGAWSASALIKRMRFQVSLLSGLCYYLTLLAVTALLFGGQYSDMGITALMVGIGSAGIALIPHKKSSGYQKKKHAYR